jgi:hypothetical protein
MAVFRSKQRAGMALRISCMVLPVPEKNISVAGCERDCLLTYQFRGTNVLSGLEDSFMFDEEAIINLGDVAGIC